MRCARSFSLRSAALICAAVLALAGCKRSSEADMRAALSDWVPLGETISFAAKRGCAAGIFGLVDKRIASKMPVVADAQEAAMILGRQGAVALDDTRLSPDQAILALIETDRSSGMVMRMAGLEARDCMDPQMQLAFAAALVNPRAVLLVGRDQRILALMDVDTSQLIAAMGAK